MVPVVFRFFLRMKLYFNSAPVAEQEEKVHDPDHAVVVQIGRATRRTRHVARPPRRQQEQQVEEADRFVLVEVAEDRDVEREGE